MPAAGSCRVCALPEEPRIRAAREAGASWRALSKAFDLPVTTIRDHLKSCGETGRPKGHRPGGPGWAEFWALLFDVLGEFPEAETALRKRLASFLSGEVRLPGEALARLKARTEDRRG